MRNNKEYNNKVNGITEGIIWKQILAFFFPILAGTFFQMLYNTVDAIIVGQFLGKEALAAVGGGTGTMINLIIGFFTGVSSGATVVISQFYGAKEDERTKKALHTSMMLAIVGGILISILGYIFTVPLLRLIKTPEDILPLATTYLHIYFAGALTIVLYNITAGIFRAVGDSRHPFYFLIIGSVVNIVLDIFFVATLKMGVGGAAWATIASQFTSAILAIIWLRRRKDSCKLSIRHLAFTPSILNKILVIGLPAGIQSIMYNISNMIIQTRVNSLGTNSAAAWAAYGKLDAVFWMIINAFGISITTFVGQNYGAGKIDRAKKGVREVFLMSLIATLFLELLYICFGRYGYMIFVTDSNVIDIGMQIMYTVAPSFICYISIEILSGACRGAGKAIVPTLFTVIGICGFRATWLSFKSLSSSIKMIMLCYPLSWTLVSVLFFIYYRFGNIYQRRDTGLEGNKRHFLSKAELEEKKMADAATELEIDESEAP